MTNDPSASSQKPVEDKPQAGRRVHFAEVNDVPEPPVAQPATPPSPGQAAVENVPQPQPAASVSPPAQVMSLQLEEAPAPAGPSENARKAAEFLEGNPKLEQLSPDQKEAYFATVARVGGMMKELDVMGRLSEQM